MLPFLRSAALTLSISACAVVNAVAQTPQLVFTAAVPGRSSSDAALTASPAVEERGLALWAGSASDFGIGVGLSTGQWTLRSITSMTALSVNNRARPTFQQFEVVRPVLSIGSVALAAGGGVRQEWDGMRVLIGRMLVGSDLGRGRLQGSLVVERALSSPLNHDTADLVTSVGWSRPIGGRISLGVESIGQDLEGLWDPAERDGGAKLLVGPSLHAHSISGKWSASVTAGPVLQGLSTIASPNVPSSPHPDSRHYGMFASASWVPSGHR